VALNGGKFHLAPWIVAQMPPCIHFVEPYFGGGSVLLARNPDGVSEVANDLDECLINFWQVLQDPEMFEMFRRHVEAVPFSEEAWKAAEWMEEYAPLRGRVEVCKVDLAAAFFVRCRQSLAGRMKSFSGVTKTRTRRGMNNEVSAWLSAVEGLPLVHERLKRVLILCRPALEVIRGQDGPDTLFYIDCPYLLETRSTGGDYRHEMTEADHEELLVALGNVKGKFVLSGYPSRLYEAHRRRNGWWWLKKEIPNHAAGGREKRVMTECLWMNYRPPGA
jgi:DNA adenine methylase